MSVFAVKKEEEEEEKEEKEEEEEEKGGMKDAIEVDNLWRGREQSVRFIN